MIALLSAGKSDIPLIREMAFESWPDAYGSILSPAQLQYMLETIYSASSLLEQMERLHQKFFLLEVSGEFLGFAAYSGLNSDNMTFKLNKFYLLPKYKGKGYGKTFMELVFTQIINAGGRKIVLNVNRYNPAVRFYEHCGFYVIAKEDIPIGEYWMNDFVMEKNI